MFQCLQNNDNNINNYFYLLIAIQLFSSEESQSFIDNYFIDSEAQKGHKYFY